MSESPADYSPRLVPQQWSKDWNNPDDGLGPLIEPAQPAAEIIERAALASLDRVEVMAEYHAGPHAGNHIAAVYRATAAKLLAEAEKLTPAPPLAVGEGQGAASRIVIADTKHIEERLLAFKAGVLTEEEGLVNYENHMATMLAHSEYLENQLDALSGQLQDTEAARVAAENGRMALRKEAVELHYELGELRKYKQTQEWLTSMRANYPATDATAAADKLEEAITTLAARLKEEEATTADQAKGMLERDEELRKLRADKWVPVEERLPEYKGYVVACLADGRVIGCYCDPGFDYDEDGETGTVPPSWDGGFYTNVTHWQPLPAPPRAEEPREGVVRG